MSELSQYEEDIKYLMSVPKGRSFFWVLLSDCGIFKSNYSQDHSLMSFNEGKRDIGLKIYESILRLCPNEYLKMAKEAKENEETSKNDSEHIAEHRGE